MAFETANDYFGQIIRNIATDLMGKRLAALGQSLDAAEAKLNASAPSPLGGEGWGEGQSPFLQARISRLRDFQQKVNKTWNNPIVKMMLK